MNQRKLVMLLGGAVLALSSLVLTAHAQSPQQIQTQSRVQTQERVYGSQLMTPQERLEQRNRMLGARTPQERERIRAEHHRRMQVRAQERGVTLPDAPLRQGGGMGPGRGMGGMGPGGGMGGGRR
jgi:hypothetical protein